MAKLFSLLVAFGIIVVLVSYGTDRSQSVDAPPPALESNIPTNNQTTSEARNPDLLKRMLFAQDAISKYAKMQGITVSELDKRIGISQDGLVDWIAGFADDDGMDKVFERLGYISNIETINTENDAKTPEQAKQQRQEPEYEITSTELSREYLQNAEIAQAKFEGHRVKVSGLLVDSSPNANLLDLTPKNPPRVSFFNGFLNGDISDKKLDDSSIPFTSESKYNLSGDEKKQFARLRSGETVILVCTVTGLLKYRMAVPDLKECSIFTQP